MLIGVTTKFDKDLFLSDMRVLVISCGGAVITSLHDYKVQDAKSVVHLALAPL